LSDQEQERLEAGLHARDLYEVRRCQILLASARGEWVPRIAELLGCNDQTVRNVLRECERDGLDACLTPGSSRPHTIHAKVDEVGREQIRALLHQSPRTFGKPTSVWTMELAAEVSFAEGITAELVSGETIRQAIGRLASVGSGPRSGSPARTPSTHETKSTRPPDSAGRQSSAVGLGLPR
jgi:transposase